MKLFKYDLTAIHDLAATDNCPHGERASESLSEQEKALTKKADRCTYCLPLSLKTLTKKKSLLKEAKD